MNSHLQIRNVFQQRSRWTKASFCLHLLNAKMKLMHMSLSLGFNAQGHFQIFFQPAVCPLFQRKLSLGMRLMYSTGIWSYIVCGLCTPFYLVRIKLPALSMLCAEAEQNANQAHYLYVKSCTQFISHYVVFPVLLIVY